MDILALLQPIEDSLSKATLRQTSPVILSMTGRVTMLGLSRWAEAGGSYRSIQRFYHTVIPWAQVFTAEREVNAMLDLVKQKTERVDSRLLQPACAEKG